MTSPPDLAREELELRFLMDAVRHLSGLNLAEYAQTSLKRRIRNFLKDQELPTISSLTERILHQQEFLSRFLYDISVNVTAMFRDPGFYLALRTKVVPHLKTYPSVRAWVAGCSTGEEAYSLAVVLSEEGLTDKIRIYATDANAEVLERAKEGIFPLAAMKTYTKNYQAAGGQGSFSEFYSAHYDRAILKADLRRNILFAQHNLSTDGSFNEFNLIFCRNVMIYFGRELQGRVHRLLYDSLAHLGILGLGDKESLSLTPHEQGYVAVDRDHKLYKRIG